jgi:hypothetical protein
LEKLPGYDRKTAYATLFPPGRQLPYDEAKKRIMQLMGEFEAGGLEQKMEGKTPTQKQSAASGGLFGLPPLTRTQAAFGLAALVLILATAYSFGAAAPLAATTYTTIASVPLAPLY